MSVCGGWTRVAHTVLILMYPFFSFLDDEFVQQRSCHGVSVGKVFTRP